MSPAPDAPLPHEALAAQIAEAEAQLYRAQVAGSVAGLEPLLAADLRYVHSTGVAESKAVYLDGVATRLYEYGTIMSHDVRLHSAGELVVQDGIVDMTVAAHGAAKTLIHLLFCLIWRREHSRWTLLYRQATRLG